MQIYRNQNQQDEKGFICEQAFAYTTTGGMLAKKGRFELQAKHTLDVLNLNNNELKRQREESCFFLFEDAEQGLVFDLTPEEVSKLRNNYQQRDEQLHFQPFCATVLYFLNNSF